jgi:potassium-transporting ATPase KdpC subunit
MFSQIRPALLLFAALSVLTGIVYPLAVTGIGQALFAARANGSLVVIDGKPRGSRLIGQPFSVPEYFWSRPSATSPIPYDASGSTGSNLGPTNPALVKSIADRVAALHVADPGNTADVPADLVTASASGLDPDISPDAAAYQAGRVARVRGLDPGRVCALVAQYTIPRTFGVLGEPRVNVLALNRALDAGVPQAPR